MVDWLGPSAVPAPILPDIVLLALIPALLLASAFFSGSETALFSLSAHQRLTFARRRSMASHAAGTLLAETRDLLITLMLGNMVANVLFFVVSTVLLIRLEKLHHAGPTTIGLLSFASLLLVILTGEVLPKLVANRVQVGWVTVTGVPLLALHRAVMPLRLTLRIFVINPLARLIAPPQRPHALSAAELGHLLDLSARRGVIHPEEQGLLQGVLELSRLRVREIMTPRVDLVAFDSQRPVDELINLLKRSRRSHIPIYRGDLDNLLGIIEARQVLLRRPSTPGQLRRLVRQVAFVPELQRADQLLVDFRKRGHNLAIAVDEYGGTAGLVTLEDVVEQFIGDMPGTTAHDEGSDVEKLGEGTFRVRAGLPLQDWYDSFDTARPAMESVTLGGLVMSRLGRLPQVGDVVREGNLLLEVERMGRRRIETLRVSVIDEHHGTSHTSATPPGDGSGFSSPQRGRP